MCELGNGKDRTNREWRPEGGSTRMGGSRSMVGRQLDNVTILQLDLKRRVGVRLARLSWCTTSEGEAYRSLEERNDGGSMASGNGMTDQTWDTLNLQLQPYSDLLGTELEGAKVRVTELSELLYWMHAPQQQCLCDTCDILSFFLTMTCPLHSVR